MPYQNKIGNFRASLSLCLNSGGWISPRRLELLAAIGRTNSISNGAKAVGMTYRGAWVAVEEMNSLAGVPLVKSWQGGHRGGGAELTEVGQQLVVELSRLSALQTQLFQSVAVFNEFD
ncbi:winged helix-turn-helix domain-containing protein [Candidatus Nitrotoga sp. AM1P]|uniref:winged helix-turn-helix domain-containing protein n=1 Tax=Candidatus Nitrotoga sp. AM1P TaxID=2559597 RepID=UPI0015673E05|nr:LysR family transcriptional regulator [Candidatus Nitrotoga sp. AM1P]